MFDHAAPPPQDKPDCPHCAAVRAAAESTPAGERIRTTGQSDASCLGCIAREIATGPAAWRALHSLTAVDLHNAISRHWPGNQYKAGRQAVWAWCQLLRLVP